MLSVAGQFVSAAGTRSAHLVASYKRLKLGRQQFDAEGVVPHIECYSTLSFLQLPLSHFSSPRLSLTCFLFSSSALVALCALARDSPRALSVSARPSARPEINTPSADFANLWGRRPVISLKVIFLKVTFSLLRFRFSLHLTLDIFKITPSVYILFLCVA